MELKYEIEKLIRDKVDAGENKLEGGQVWERIQDTLKKEKRRRAFYTWSLNSVIILFSVVGIYALVSNLDETENSNNKMSVSTKDIKNDVDNSFSANSVLEESVPPDTKKQSDDALDDKKNTTATANKTEEQKNPVAKTNKKEHHKKTKKQPIKKTNKPSEVANSAVIAVPENTDQYVAERTEKVYYYYNNKNGQELMTRDKRVIDSVMKANAAMQDSLR